MRRLQEIPSLDDAGSVAQQLPLPAKAVVSRIDLYHLAWLQPIIKSRWPQFILRLVTLLGFSFTILAGLFGSPVGSHNFAIIMVWIAWWTTLKLGFIPWGGRSWCSICPIPLPGEWLQQAGILEKGQRKIGYHLRWPKSLRGSWLQSAGFLLIGLFSALTLTDPHVTGWVLLALFGLATLMSLVFQHRAFCSYVCPVGGFSGMYSKAAPVEIKVINPQVCEKHGDKSCYQACPWGIYPLTMKDSSACGLCMECLRACPKDNLAFNLRPYGTDLKSQATHDRLDETFLALVMLGSVLSFSAVFQGPWGWIKSAALDIGSRGWLVYSAGFLLLSLVILPACFVACVWLWRKISRSYQPLKHMLANQAQGLLPLGLMAWIAFTISFALPKLGMIPSVLNDPFGWGWHLLNLSSAGFPDVSGMSSLLQVLLVLVGVVWSARVTRNLEPSGSNKPRILNIPMLAFYLLVSSALLWLLVG